MATGDNTRVITIKFAANSKGVVAGVAEVDAALNKLGTGSGKSGVDKLTTSLNDFGDTISNKVAPTARTIGLVTEGLSSVNKIVPAIVSTAGVLGLLPGVIGVAAGAMAVLKLGSAGVSAAFKGVATEAQTSVSGVFQKDLAPSTKSITDLFKQMTPTLDTVAHSMSGVLNSITKTADSKADVAGLNVIMGSTNTVVKNVGAAFAPLTDAVIKFIAVAAPDFARLTSGAGAWAQKLDDWVTKIAGNGKLNSWINGGIANFESLAKKGEEDFKKIFDALKPLASVRVTLFSGLLNAMLPFLTWLGQFISAHPQLGNWIVGVALAFQVLGPAIKGLAVAIDLLTGGPIGLIIIAIALLVTGFVYLWNKSAAFRVFWIDAWKDIQTVVKAVVLWFQTSVWPVLQKLFADLLVAVKLVVSWFQVTFLPTWRIIWTAVSTAFQAFVVFFQAAWNSGLGDFVKIALGVLAVVIKVAWDIIVTVFKVAWDIIVTVLRVAWDVITGIFVGAFDIIKGIFEIFTGILTGNWSKVWQGIKDILSGAWSVIWGIIKAIGDTFSGLGSIIADVWHGIGNVIADVWNGIVGILEGAIRLIGDVVSAVSRLFGASQQASAAGNAINSAVPSVAQGRARAGGGPVSPGVSYLVGERGQEIFTPKTPGTIIPADQTADIIAGVGEGAGFTGDVHLTLDLGAGITQRIALSNQELKRRAGAGSGTRRGR